MIKFHSNLLSIACWTSWVCNDEVWRILFIIRGVSRNTRWKLIPKIESKLICICMCTTLLFSFLHKRKFERKDEMTTKEKKEKFDSILKRRKTFTFSRWTLVDKEKCNSQKLNHSKVEFLSSSLSLTRCSTNVSNAEYFPWYIRMCASSATVNLKRDRFAAKNKKRFFPSTSFRDTLLTFPLKKLLHCYHCCSKCFSLFLFLFRCLWSGHDRKQNQFFFHSRLAKKSIKKKSILVENSFVQFQIFCKLIDLTT